jgi:hypothetical protein
VQRRRKQIGVAAALPNIIYFRGFFSFTKDQCWGKKCRPFSSFLRSLRFSFILITSSSLHLFLYTYLPFSVSHTDRFNSQERSSWCSLGHTLEETQSRQHDEEKYSHLLSFISLLTNETSVDNDLLCGLVVRVSGYRSRGLGSIPVITRFYEK